MVLRFFRSTGTQIIIFIVVVGILLWIAPILKSVSGIEPVSMPLYKYLLGWSNTSPILSTALALVFILFEAFWLVNLNTRFILINNRTYLPAVFFIILTGLIPQAQQFNPAIVASFFLILFFENLLDSYRNNNTAYQFFNAALFLGIGSLFYPFLSIYIILLWIGLAVFRPFYWREWLFSILGFLLPVTFSFSYYYLVLNNPLAFFNSITEILFLTIPHTQLSIAEYSLLGCVGFIVLISSQFILKNSKSQKILPRKAFNVLFWMFALTAIIYFSLWQIGFEIIYLAAIPLSYLLAYYFSNAKATKWANILLVALIVFLLIAHIF
jgi:hypothetical protein